MRKGRAVGFGRHEGQKEVTDPWTKRGRHRGRKRYTLRCPDLGPGEEMDV